MDVYTTACISNIIFGCLCSRKKEGLFVWIMKILWIISDIHASQSHERHRRVSSRHSVGLEESRSSVALFVHKSISYMVTNANPFPDFNLTLHFSSWFWCDDDKLRTFLYRKKLNKIYILMTRRCGTRIPFGFSVFPFENLHKIIFHPFNYALIKGTLK